MKFIAIEDLWYADPIQAVTETKNGLTGAEIKAILANAQTKKLSCMADGTWEYTEDDGDSTDYRCHTKKIYHRSYTPGDKQINFSIATYDFQTKADLQGGTATTDSWTAPERADLVYKCIIAKTKGDANSSAYIVFPYASISANTSMVEDEIIGIAVSAVPMETGVEGLPSEKWFKASQIA